MSSPTKNIIIGILLLLVVALLLRFVVFKDRIDERGEDLDRIDERQQSYKQQHPDATQQDIDQAWEDLRSQED